MVRSVEIVIHAAICPLLLSWVNLSRRIVAAGSDMFSFCTTSITDHPPPTVVKLRRDESLRLEFLPVQWDCSAGEQCDCSLYAIELWITYLIFE